jgi:hypothetical protein
VPEPKIMSRPVSRVWGCEACIYGRGPHSDDCKLQPAVVALAKEVETEFRNAVKAVFEQFEGTLEALGTDEVFDETTDLGCEV